jgi:hypothetical protein
MTKENVMHRSITAAAVVVMAGLLATVVLAGTVNGTPKNDVLRGSAKADTINGKAGNDKLYGLVGNDRLVGGPGNDLLDGGPGADSLNCGAGNDAAQADDSDQVSPSCEKVTGITPPAVSIADASVVEGNAGSSTLVFSVSLSKATKRPVSMNYSTADGSATAPADYASASGALTFAPGERAKTIAVSAVGELAIEQDETVTVTLSSAINATIAKGTATGTIKNDDTQVPVTAGRYQGATQNGDYVFLTVLPNRTVTGFRVNNVTESCNGPIRLTGSINWTTDVFGIRDDASFVARGDWSGSEVQGDVEWTKWHADLDGKFSGNSVSGTLLIQDELKYRGTPYQCSTGRLTWTATLQG